MSEVWWLVLTGTDEAWRIPEQDSGSLWRQEVILQLLGHGVILGIWEKGQDSWGSGWKLGGLRKVLLLTEREAFQ